MKKRLRTNRIERIKTIISTINKGIFCHIEESFGFVAMVFDVASVVFAVFVWDLAVMLSLLEAVVADCLWES